MRMGQGEVERVCLAWFAFWIFFEVDGEAVLKGIFLVQCGY